MAKPKKTAKKAQEEHRALQGMGMSTHADSETQKASKEHQGHKSFRDCPACKRRNRAYDITD